MNLKPLGKRLHVRRIRRRSTANGIVLPEMIQDDDNYGGPKEYLVLQVGPQVKEIQAGQRVICHSYTTGPAPMENDESLITQDEVILVLP